MIPRDQIVAVTGAPRSGTSALMRALQLAGLPVSGEQWPAARRWERRIERAAPENRARLVVARERARERYERLNPGGFFEIGGVVVRGLREVGEYGGRIIKIVAPGILPPSRGRGTSPGIVWRYLLCVRDPRAVVTSQRDLNAGVQVAGEGGWNQPRLAAIPRRYLRQCGMLAYWLANGFNDLEPPDLRRWHAVDYDVTVANPRRELARCCDFLGWSPSPHALDEAAASYTPALRRSPARFEGWPPEAAADAAAAELVYEALKTLDRDLLGAARLAVEERREHHALERSRWYAPEVGWIVDASMARKAAADETFRATLRKAAMRSIESGFHPQVCTQYEAPPDAPTYTIRRPIDLGDLVVAMVRYRGEWMTREDAYRAHQITRSTDPGAAPPLDPVKLAAWAWRW